MEGDSARRAVPEGATRKKSGQSMAEGKVYEGGSTGKTPNKALTKAERRAIQEAQRAAKEAAGQAKGSNQATGKAQALPTAIKPTMGGGKDGSTAMTTVDHKAAPHHGGPQRMELFSHLPVNEVRGSANLGLGVNDKLHPAVIQAGLWFNRGVISTSNARCHTMLDAFKQMIGSYEGAADKELRRDLEAKMRPHISYLTECRPMSVSMRNAIKFLKLTISNLDPALTEEEAKAELMEAIDHFARGRITLAVEEISKLARERIVDGDTIVTFMAPTAVETALIDAHRVGRRFSVIILDSHPSTEGRTLTRRLSEQGVSCTYAQISAAGYAMKEATKVFLGAHSFFANAHMLAPAGASVVALVAKSCGVPVLVCCETYKFWAQRVQTDSFVFNELDPPDTLVRGTALESWRTHDTLHIINLKFDVTPPDFIDMVVTEIGCIPCSSVPVIIREYDVYKEDAV